MVAVAPHIRSTVDDDGAVILDIRKDRFLSLNPSGAFIWTRLLKGEEVEQIAASLALESGQDISIVTADVRDFVAELNGKDLLDVPLALGQAE